MINQQFAEGNIIVSSNDANSVPEAAIIRSENNDFLLELNNETNDSNYFKPVKVTTGRTYNNFTELVGDLPGNKILTHGSYNIQIE